MALNRRTATPESTGENDYTNLEEREYESRLVYVADLGLQEGQEWAGEKKPDCQQIALGFEILGETVTVDGEEKPRMLWSETINIFSNLTEKGKEIKYYSAFDPTASDGDIPDWDAQLGKPCNVFVVHSPDKKKPEIVYDNIGKVDPIPTKYQGNVPPATIEPAIGDADDPNNVVTKALWGLPKYVYDKRLGQQERALSPNGLGQDDDDIPY